ncbi:hypothetical protein [Gloeocapsopsis sp. IPPAS B-1203]|uniref:hypothetical protein n=1 Tax=Gloeocapsopsis sp. IPPAS B-1203 TaxID=2049454 RepID=UPI00117D1DF9|nr:hypothetical protein [Gloeocapsopsis sp. IPPAS B-1203]
MATTVQATQPNSNAIANVNTVKSQNLIAQMYPRSRFDATRTRPFIDEMILLHMQMVDAAQRAMQSSDTEIKKMAEETMKFSNARINSLMEMRRSFLENPDKG